MYLCIYLFIYLFIYLCIYLSIYRLLIYLFKYVHMYFFLSVFQMLVCVRSGWPVVSAELKSLFFFFFFFFFSIIKYLLINFLHHLHYRTLIANTNYRTVLTILTIQIVLITILTLTLLIDTITALRKEEQKRWPTYLHSLLINAKTYRPFYLFTFVIRFFFFFIKCLFYGRQVY